MNLDTINGRAEAEIAVSELLGFPVKIDKEANRVTVYRLVVTCVTLGEIAEQALLAAADPVGLLVMAAQAAVCPPPAFVAVPIAAMVRGGGGFLQLPTSEGLRMLRMFSSSRAYDAVAANNELFEMLTTAVVQCSGTLVLLDVGYKVYQDPHLPVAQAWCDGAVLPGVWQWCVDTQQMERVPV